MGENVPPRNPTGISGSYKSSIGSISRRLNCFATLIPCILIHTLLYKLILTLPVHVYLLPSDYSQSVDLPTLSLSYILPSIWSLRRQSWLPKRNKFRGGRPCRMVSTSSGWSRHLCPLLARTRFSSRSVPSHSTTVTPKVWSIAKPGLDTSLTAHPITDI